MSAIRAQRRFQSRSDVAIGGGIALSSLQSVLAALTLRSPLHHPRHALPRQRSKPEGSGAGLSRRSAPRMLQDQAKRGSLEMEKTESGHLVASDSPNLATSPAPARAEEATRQSEVLKRGSRRGEHWAIGDAEAAHSLTP